MESYDVVDTKIMRQSTIGRSNFSSPFYVTIAIEIGSLYQIVNI